MAAGGLPYFVFAILAMELPTEGDRAFPYLSSRLHSSKSLISFSNSA